MSVMAGGSETTLEDRIIYDEHIFPMIKETREKLFNLIARRPDFKDYEIQALLETLVYKVVKYERGL